MPICEATRSWICWRISALRPLLPAGMEAAIQAPGDEEDDAAPIGPEPIGTQFPPEEEVGAPRGPEAIGTQFPPDEEVGAPSGPEPIGTQPPPEDDEGEPGGPRENDCTPPGADGAPSGGVPSTNRIPEGAEATKSRISASISGVRPLLPPGTFT